MLSYHVPFDLSQITTQKSKAIRIIIIDVKNSNDIIFVSCIIFDRTLYLSNEDISFRDFSFQFHVDRIFIIVETTLFSCVTKSRLKCKKLEDRDKVKISVTVRTSRFT